MKPGLHAITMETNYMGQELLNPPTVEGWHTGREWIYVTDWGNDRVQVLTSDGRHITTFTGDAGLSKWGEEKLYASPDMVLQRSLVRDFTLQERFHRPKAVAIDDEGRIIIVDPDRGRLQVYRKDDY